MPPGQKGKDAILIKVGRFTIHIGFKTSPVCADRGRNASDKNDLCQPGLRGDFSQGSVQELAQALERCTVMRRDGIKFIPLKTNGAPGSSSRASMWA